MKTKTLFPRHLIIAFLTVVIVSCNEETVLPEDNLSVSFLAVSNQARQQFFAYKTGDAGYATEGNQHSFDQYFMPGIAISLLDNDRLAHQFVQVIDTSLGASKTKRYYSNPDSLSILPGDRLSVQAHLHSGSVFGTTIVPGDFDIVLPEDRAIVLTGSYSFGFLAVWSHSEGATFYLLNVVHHAELMHMGTVYIVHEETPFISRDTSYYCTVPIFSSIPGESWILEVFACDSSYDNHRFKGLPRAGISGDALGFFGSAVKKQRRIQLQ